MEDPSNPVIFALDAPNLIQARELVSLLSPHVGMFKIGLELFIAEGPPVVREVLDSGARVFLDLKLHDIPKTVERAMGVLSGYGVSLATVHTTGGPEMLKAAVQGAAGQVGVLGVTVLTSTGGNQEEISRQVLERAVMAKDAGCAGVVCSGLEAASVRRETGDDFLIVTPGVRLADDESKDDQKRVVTPYSAIKSGSSYLVIGRPIRDAEDPAKAARLFVAQAAEALA